MAHLGGHLRIEAATRQLLRLFDINAAQQILHPRHRAAVHRQMAVTEADKDRHAHRVARHLAAQAQIDAKALRVMGDHRQRPQYRRMQAVIHAGDPGIVAVDGQQVLGQVVRPYRDKIDPAGQLRQHKDHRRDLQHHPQARTWDGVADHLFHFPAGAIDQPTGLIHFLQTGHHRQQNAEVAGGGVGAQHRPHLDQKDLRLIEGDADPAPAEARVLFADRHIRQLFIRADVQGTQGHRFAVKHLQHALILGDLLLF